MPGSSHRPFFSFHAVTGKQRTPRPGPHFWDGVHLGADLWFSPLGCVSVPTRSSLPSIKSPTIPSSPSLPRNCYYTKLSGNLVLDERVHPLVSSCLCSGMTKQMRGQVLSSLKSSTSPPPPPVLYTLYIMGLGCVCSFFLTSSGLAGPIAVCKRSQTPCRQA